MSNARRLMQGESWGVVKILSAPATGVALGGSIGGRNAAELISVVALAVTNRLTVTDIVDSLLVHPALAEELFGEERRFLEILEQRYGMKVNISASDKYHIEQYRIEPS